MVRKPAYRVTLENGTELITSADHRFLTGRGWKHVIGAEQGPLQRPHLTLNSKLMGTGAFAESPLGTREYKRGYLCGMIRGDGHLSTPRLRATERRRGEQTLPPRADGLRSAGPGAELSRGTERRDDGYPVRGRRRSGIERCTRSARSPGIRRHDQRAHRMAGPDVARVGQGLSRRHLRRGGQLRLRHRQDLQHAIRRSSTGPPSLAGGSGSRSSSRTCARACGTCASAAASSSNSASTT